MKQVLRNLPNVLRTLFRFPGATPAPIRQVAPQPARVFAVFVVAVTALSILGGFQLSRLTHRINNAALQHADQLLAVEEGLDAAVITLGRQIQEWKDMLLRANKDGRYAAHRQAFIESSVGVQKALLQTGEAMRVAGMDSGVVERLSTEHKALLARYVAAHVKLDPQRTDSSRMVDEQVIGMDRELQQHLDALKAEIELRAKQQLTGADPQGDPYLLLGFLGASALFTMALIGFAFATRMQGPAGQPRP